MTVLISNTAGAVNAPIPSLFAIARQGQRATDQRRSAATHACCTSKSSERFGWDSV